MVYRLPYNLNDLLCTSLSKEEMSIKLSLCYQNDFYIKDLIKNMVFANNADKAAFNTAQTAILQDVNNGYFPTLLGVNELAMNHVVNRQIRLKFKQQKDLLKAIKQYGLINQE